jgi:hypothetical protein
VESLCAADEQLTHIVHVRLTELLADGASDIANPLDREATHLTNDTQDLLLIDDLAVGEFRVLPHERM